MLPESFEQIYPHIYTHRHIETFSDFLGLKAQLKLRKEYKVNRSDVLPCSK